jgi:hypothetical protein
VVPKKAEDGRNDDLFTRIQEILEKRKKKS